MISEQVTTRYVSLIALAIDRKNFKTAIGLLGQALRSEAVSGLVPPLRGDWLGASHGPGVCRLIIRDAL